jgi:methyl-accepting chemotaxis protein
MHPVIQRAKRQIDFWILAVLTPGGITLLVFYIILLIPNINGDLVGWALGGCAVPTLILIGIHKLKMNRRWKIADAFVSQTDASVTAGDALKSMMDFPIKMPGFGLLAWVVGGAGAAAGAYIGTDAKILLSDLSILYLGIVAGAVIITIFQFYMWRHIIGPVLSQIIRQAPDVLDRDLDMMRVPIKSALIYTLIPLIVLGLFISEMAGYRQAAATLQSWEGNQRQEEVLRAGVTVDWKLLPADEATRASTVTALNSNKTSTNKVYLIERRDDGDYEMLQGKPFREIYPKVVMKQIRALFSREMVQTTDANQQTSHQFNPFGPEIMVILRHVEGSGPAAREYFLINAYPWGNYRGQLNTLVVYSVILMAVMIFISAGIAYIIARDIQTPIARLVEFTGEVGQGDIHGNVFYHANDEIGDLALALRKMSRQLGDVITRIKNAAGSLDAATGAIRGSAEQVKKGAQSQEEAIDDVASAMSEMDHNIQGIADNVEVLSSSAEESSSSIFEMSAAIKKINESVDVQNEAINSVASSINEMTAAMDQVAENVTNLSATAEQTASGMAEMDAAIREVKQTTNDTAELSGSVIRDAEAGVDAVSRVNKGMLEIADVVNAAQKVIERLGERVQAIGKIVKVIDDVANQTNLLALNAAIIAAQAGEHGRGFAVVADEIKELADRTQGSTREIHQLIRNVQDESREAVGAIEDGARAVEEGVQLVELSSRSLEKIHESAHSATDRVQGIAHTTIEQAESSRQVSVAIDQVAEMVNQISVATQEQSRGGVLILKSTEEMKAASLQVKRNAEEQLQGSKLITKSMENITDMLYSINQAQQEQKRASHQVVQLMERIKVVSQDSTESASRLAQVVDALSAEAETLREEMRRFKIAANHNPRGQDG